MGYISQYPESALLYVGIMLLCVMLAIIASKEKRKASTYVIAIIVILSVFEGLRGESVGIDVSHYIIRHIEPIREGAFAKVNQPIGFKIIVWISYLISSKTSTVFLLFAFITNGLIVLRLWDFRHKASFPFMVFFYYCFHYLITFNVFRQYIAIAIVFYVSRYIDEKKYLKYGIGVIVATLIHSTSVLGFLLIPIDILTSDENVKQWRLRYRIIFASPILIFLVVGLFFNFDYEHYIDLFKNYGSGSLGSMTLVKIAIAIGIFVCMYKNKKNNQEIKKIFTTYCIGLFISLLVAVAIFADRFAWYYLIWEPVFMSYNLKRRDNKILVRGVYVLLALYTLYLNLSVSGQGIMPYISVFH